MKKRAIEPPSFEDWTNRLKVYNDYIKALGEYKKSSAEAELKLAEAAGLWSKAEAMRVVIRQMVRELQRLHRQTGQVQTQVKRIGQLARRARLLLAGRRLEGFSQAWSAYQYFELRAMLESEADLTAVLLPVDSHDAVYFLDNRFPQRACQPLPTEIGTALGLAAWLRTSKYMVRSGSPPHTSLAHLFRAINSVAEREVQSLLAALDALRKGTYDSWKLPQILGVPLKSRRWAIEQAPWPRSTKPSPRGHSRE